jgi:CheY-like chemotaxis protein
MFSQVEEALSRSKGGLGIGLCLVKKLVELHGGDIEAKSKGAGQGSEFVVRLPMVVESTSSQKCSGEPDKPAPNSGMRILVVDDNRDAAATLAMMLRISGNEVRSAHDGGEAVRAADEFRPQVVLLDIGLPIMNGYEVALAIRKEPWGKNVILIAVTGWGQEKDKRNSEAAGFDRHMVKPVDPQALLNTLAALDVAKEAAPKTS